VGVGECLRALEKTGFRALRAIIRQAGLSVDEFVALV
jgi:hypothetical protein